MRIVTIKSILLFLTILLLAFSFSIQVMTFSPLPALAPYVILACVFLLTIYHRPSSFKFRWSPHQRIIFWIIVYLVLLFFNTGWQTVLSFINPYQGVSAILVFGLPVMFFIYFRSFATNQEFRAVFFAILLAGLISASFYVYDSYSMMVLGQVSEYNISVMDYIEMRSISDGAQNIARITPFSRSHGLLEKHSVSAAWIVLGCFGALTLLPKSKPIKRMMIILIFSLILLTALNVTSIALFVFVVLLMEYRSHSILYGVPSKRTINLILTIITGAVLVSSLYFLLPDSVGVPLAASILNIISYQVDLVGGNLKHLEFSYFEKMIHRFISYPEDVFPLGVLIGDGFSTFGYSKGGDYGIVESLHRFGVPFFFATLIGLLRLIRCALKQIYRKDQKQSLEITYLWFAVCTTLYIVLADIHYSLWPMKSMLPIIFINLAIFDRYLHSPNQQQLLRKSQSISTPL